MEDLIRELVDRLVEAVKRSVELELTLDKVTEQRDVQYTNLKLLEEENKELKKSYESEKSCYTYVSNENYKLREELKKLKEEKENG